MSPIVARSVASFYACKPNLKNWNIFEAFLYTFLGGRPTTETICIILVCFDGKYTWVYNKMLKIEKVCLRTYYIADHLKRPRGLGSLVAGEGLVLVIRLPAIHVFRQHESHLVNWSHESHLVNWSHESHSHVSRISSRELVSRIAFPCLTNLISRTDLTNRIPMSHESHPANWSHESHSHVSRISSRELVSRIALPCLTNLISRTGRVRCRFLCGSCAESFSSKHLLRAHVKSSHSDVTLREIDHFECGVCKKNLRSASALAGELKIAVCGKLPSFYVFQFHALYEFVVEFALTFSCSLAFGCDAVIFVTDFFKSSLFQVHRAEQQKALCCVFVHNTRTIGHVTWQPQTVVRCLKRRPLSPLKVSRKEPIITKDPRHWCAWLKVITLFSLRCYVTNRQ